MPFAIEQIDWNKEGLVRIVSRQLKIRKNDIVVNKSEY